MSERGQMTMDTPTLAEAVERLRESWERQMRQIELVYSRREAMSWAAMDARMADLAVMLAAVERLEHERDHLKRMVDRVIEQRGYVADDSVFDQLLAQYDAATHDAGHADTTGAGA